MFARRRPPFFISRAVEGGKIIGAEEKITRPEVLIISVENFLFADVFSPQNASRLRRSPENENFIIEARASYGLSFAKYVKFYANLHEKSPVCLSEWHFTVYLRFKNAFKYAGLRPKVENSSPVFPATAAKGPQSSSKPFHLSY